MQETLIKFETAKLAKEKGFDEVVNTAYGKHPDSLYKSNCTHKNSENGFLSAPTQSLLQKWLRVEHLIDVIVSREGTIQTFREGFSVMIYSTETTVFPWELGGVHKIYEEALEQGLLEALKLIK